MSLLNEALKRAQQAQQDRCTAPPGPPLRPVEPPPRRGLGPTALLALALLLVVACAGMLLWQWRQMGGNAPRAKAVTVQSAAPTTASQAAQPQVNSEPASTASPAARKPARSVASDVAAAATSNMVAQQPIQTMTNVAVAAAQGPAQKPESFRLQGILYSPAGSVAVINGKSVRVGERIGEGSVVTITREGVTIVVGDRTNALTLEKTLRGPSQSFPTP